jgi:hypothetical protein
MPATCSSHTFRQGFVAPPSTRVGPPRNLVWEGVAVAVEELADWPTILQALSGCEGVAEVELIARLALGLGIELARDKTTLDRAVPQPWPLRRRIRWSGGLDSPGAAEEMRPVVGDGDLAVDGVGSPHGAASFVDFALVGEDVGPSAHRSPSVLK